MSDIDVPAGQPGGLSNVSEAPELPERLRVHALARLIAVTSRQVLDALEELGAPAKGAQSSIDRPTALRVIESLGPVAGSSPTTGEAAEPAEAEPAEAGSPSSVPAPLALSNQARRPATIAAPDSPAAALPLFAAPSPMFLPPEPPGPARVAPPRAAAAPASTEDDVDDTDDADAGDSVDGEDAAETKRRRRRGRRGRGRGKGSEDSEDGSSDADGEDDEREPERAERGQADDQASAEVSDEELEEAEEAADESAEDETGGTVRRRRRRRRRKDPSDSGDAETEDDPPNTVTRVRESRARSDSGDSSDNSGIQGVRGSTRLEAKRQRRRDGRDAGRRRAPVLSEAEFLARRESVERTMVVRQHGERSEIGVLEDGVLVEHFVTSSGGSSLVGNVYLGRVQNVLPSMEAAFVDIGRGRNAVLYAGEVDWDAAGLAGKARRIEQALSSGDSILVQVTKDPIGHKGARLTTQISLPGRFLVYVPSGGTHGISRKLPDTERRRLKDLLREIVPDDAGVIIRTASEGVSQEALERDVRRLQAQWEVVRTKADAAASAKGSSKSKAPELLYEEPDLMIKVVRDQFNEDFAKLVVEGDDAWDTLQAYIGHVAPELVERVRRHVGTIDSFTEFRIDEQLMKALDRKVWLPSGGTLVIDRTEAMTVIDVNTGKFTGSGGNLEETVTRNNLEAAEEIVRQLRLRDIGGIIVIDFIDMVLESNRDLVLRRLTECLGRDRTRHQVAEVTSLGLVQMTRKRVGVGLLEAFSTPCEHCRGRGVVVSNDPVEPKTDYVVQHNAGGGRRGRGRGTENRAGDSRGGEHADQGGNNGNAGSGGGSGSGNGGGRRNRSGSQGGSQSGAQTGGGGGATASEVPNGHGRRVPEPGAPNGRPVPSAPARQAETGPESAEPALDEAAAASGVEAVSTEPTPAEPAEIVVDVTEHDPVEVPPAVPTEPSLIPDDASSALDPIRPSTPGVRADQEISSEDWEPVSIGAPAQQSSRPPRRRRRAASRPAGPPASGGGGNDPV